MKDNDENMKLYLVQYCISGTTGKDNENGIHKIEFFASSDEELKEKSQGIIDTFYDEWNKKEFPDAIITLLGIYELQEKYQDMLNLINDEGYNSRQEEKEEEIDRL